MKIAVLSGKGGAGKTMVAVNLANCLKHCLYVDCDIEEPNGRLFLKPQNLEVTEVCNSLPKIDYGLCNGCRACVDLCAFNALVFIKHKPMLFQNVCHSCGGCELVCQSHAISETTRVIGHLEKGEHQDIDVLTGEMNIGEESGVKIIKSLGMIAKEYPGDVVIDCPPGSACTVMESIEDADYCILVLESTAFGFHNFCMVHELVELMHKPCGVIINKYEEAYQPLEDYLVNKKIDILMRLNYQEDLAKAISEAKIVTDINEDLRKQFENVAKRLKGDEL